jgi:hypothetical protein
MAEIFLPKITFPDKTIKTAKTTDGFNKYTSLSYFNIKNSAQNMIKFSVRPNGKAAWGDFTMINETPKSLYYDNCNVGLRTGYKTGVTIIDVDLYKMNSENIFLKKFAKELENNFNTFTVDTASGGKHYYFEYDSDIKQTQNSCDSEGYEFGIDIRNDGGYVVCPPSSINGKYYTISNDVAMTTCPEKLKQWCLDNLYLNNKTKTTKIKEKNIIESESNINTTFVVDITSEEFVKILDRLPVDKDKPICKEKDMRGSYKNWIKILKGSKFVGKKEEFIEWSKKTVHTKNGKSVYNYNDLIKLWVSAKTSIVDFSHMCELAKVSNRYTYKKVPDNNFVKYTQINKEKLDEYEYECDDKNKPIEYNEYDEEGNIICDKDGKPKITHKIISIKHFITEPTKDKLGSNIPNNMVIKSDPGTGKTTTFRNYVVKNKSKFISITSRVTLCNSQFKDLKDHIDVHHYQSKTHKFGDNILITPESCVCLSSFDFSDYVIFMDEFDSIIYHVLTSVTMKQRYSAFKTLIKMLGTCKQFICADADISSISIAFLDLLGLNYNLCINTHKNYKGVKVTVHYNEAHFFNLIKERDKCIVWSDRKRDTEMNALKALIGDARLKIITSENLIDDKDIDAHNKTAVSPVVLYGVDSQIIRGAFCHYDGSTISPSQMMQQICRTRHLTDVNIFYSDVKSKCPTFDKLSDIKFHYDPLIDNYDEKINDANKVLDCDIYDEFNGVVEILNYEIDIDVRKPIRMIKKIIPNGEMIKIFEELYRMTKYKEDCYNTNKFLHLLNILKDKGFEIINNYTTIIKIDDKEMKAKIKEDIVNNFSNTNKNVIEINNYLKIPNDKLETYKDIFINESSLTNHFNISKYFFSDNDDNLLNLDAKDDFKILKCKDISIKLTLLDGMLKTINLDKKNIDKFTAMDVKLKDTEKLKEIYLKMFSRTTKKNLDFETDYGMYKEVCSVYNKLFDITTKKQTKIKINGKLKSLRIYSIDIDKMKYHEELYNFRNTIRTKNNKLKQIKLVGVKLPINKNISKINKNNSKPVLKKTIKN